MLEPTRGGLVAPTAGGTGRAMALDVMTDLRPFLVATDTSGTSGSSPFPNRANILVEVRERFLSEADITLKIHRIVPEGWGFDFFMKDHLTIQGDYWLPETEWMIWDVQHSLPQDAEPVGPRANSTQSMGCLSRSCACRHAYAVVPDLATSHTRR